MRPSGPPFVALARIRTCSAGASKARPLAAIVAEWVAFTP